MPELRTVGALAHGRGFRAELAAEFRDNYAGSRAAANQSCAPRDPAALVPVHENAIVLLPSATAEQSAHSFIEDPSLAWRADEWLETDAAPQCNFVR